MQLWSSYLRVFHQIANIMWGLLLRTIACMSEGLQKSG